jgi:hypothetical protein
MREILEDPRAMNIGCVLGEPIKVERTFRNKETFRWEEYEFTVVHSPGHTNYQMALFATIDGARVAFTGDAFFNNPDNPDTLRHNLIYRNEVRSGDHAASIRNILDFEPNIIAPGHGRPFLLNHETALNFEQRTRQQDRFFQDLIADRDTDMGLDPSWIRIVPYQMTLVAGQSRQVQIRLRNHRQKAVQVEAAFVLPPGWTAAPAAIRLSAGPKATAEAAVQITVPANYRSALGRLALPLDVVADGRYLGQIAEAVADIRSPHT